MISAQTETRTRFASLFTVVETVTASNCDVFISYSRRDQPFVRALYETLGAAERRAWVGWEGIPPTADWLAEVFAAIRSADNFVFVLSEASLASEVCRREVEHAVECRKRLLPVALGTVDQEKVPAELRRLNWILCRGDDEFPQASSVLLEALATNLEWVREHTRLLMRAVEWRDEGRDPSLLMRGSDLREAEEWLGRGADEEPKPTDLHREYVIASRTQETRRSRQTLAVVVAGLILAIGLAVVAWMQRQEATRQRGVAEQRREEAEQRRIEAERQNVAALTNESNASLTLGRDLDALLAAVKAGRKLQHEAALRDDTNSVYRTLTSLRRAIYDSHERGRIRTGHLRGVTHLAFAPDDQSLYSVGGDGRVKRWKPSGELLWAVETGHHGMGDGCTCVQNFAVSPDGTTLATLGNDGGFALWNDRGARIGGFDSGFGSGIGFCTDILDSTIDFATRTVTMRGYEQVSVRGFAGEVVSVTAAAGQEVDAASRETFNADRSLVARYGEDQTLFIRSQDAVVLKLRQQRHPAFAHRSNRLATVSGDVDASIVHLWDAIPPHATSPQTAAKRKAAPKKKLQLGARTVTLETTFAANELDGVTSPDGRMAATVTGHYGASVQLWRLDGTTPPSVAELDVSGQLASADFPNALQSLCFSPDGGLLASGGSDGSVKLWSRDGKELRTVIAHGQMTNARFSPDGRLLLTWGDGRDGEVTVKLWTIDGTLLDSLSREQIRNAWFSEDGRWIHAKDENGRAKVWNLDLDALLRQGCTQLEWYLASPEMVRDRDVCR